MSDANEWLYIWLAYGMTVAALGGYWLRLRARRARAERDSR